MIIGDRLRALREEKKLSQGDIENITGLLRCYVSRVENGHTVPAVETLEKFARALEVPMYQLFYNGTEPPDMPVTLKAPRQEAKPDWASRGKGLRMFSKLRQATSRMSTEDRALLMYMAQKLSRRSRHVA